MTYKRFCLLTLLLLSLAVGAVYAAGALSRPDERLTDQEYLANLHGNSEFGPATFLKRRAKVLVIGDSHSYAGFDYNELARDLGVGSISACAMGGFYADTLPELVRLMREQDYRPAIIIYGFSYRQLFEGKNKQAQLAQHKRALTPERLPSLKAAARNLWTSVLLLVDRERAMPRSAELDDANVALNAPHIKALHQLDPGRMADRAGHSGLKVWDGVIAAAAISEAQRGNLASLCALVRETGAELYVFGVPESPELERRYPEPLLRQGGETVAELKSCARVLRLRSAQAWGLGDEHFVNRGLKQGYEYARWAEPGFRPDAQDFDPDHMNLVGARVFTKAVARMVVESSTVLPAIQR